MPTPLRSPLAMVALPVLLAGLIGEIAFEAYAWLISPQIFGFALQPSKLVMAIGQMHLGITLSHWMAFAIHFCIGAVGFGVFVYLVRRFVVASSWAAGLLSGVTLWFVAQGMLAPLVGRSFMMDFGPYTQSSFVGHVGMTLITAYLLGLWLPQGDEPEAKPEAA
ncbi:hypothetical protein IV417_18885 [Alphaproteobacteria bacterium KMM 3653]|uniref:DUF1440 domain-containing protein n=1 Tax=Harenicola maris TaxID=2841044 RepID=A0AAP2CUE1_9RHOB|nr:hypothetical protein [Harenicola maris]